MGLATGLWEVCMDLAIVDTVVTAATLAAEGMAAWLEVEWEDMAGMTLRW